MSCTIRVGLQDMCMNAAKVADYCRDNIRLTKENDRLRAALQTIRRDPKLWKAGRAGGCDQYQGLPPAMRLIDEVLKVTAMPNEQGG